MYTSKKYTGANNNEKNNRTNEQIIEQVQVDCKFHFSRYLYCGVFYFTLK